MSKCILYIIQAFFLLGSVEIDFVVGKEIAGHHSPLDLSNNEAKTSHHKS